LSWNKRRNNSNQRGAEAKQNATAAFLPVPAILPRFFFPDPKGAKLCMHVQTWFSVPGFSSGILVFQA
jgi:hypothetical protein